LASASWRIRKPHRKRMPFHPAFAGKARREHLWGKAPELPAAFENLDVTIFNTPEWMYSRFGRGKVVSFGFLQY
jgi:hypothetical protein